MVKVVNINVEEDDDESGTPPKTKKQNWLEDADSINPSVNSGPTGARTWPLTQSGSGTEMGTSSQKSGVSKGMGGLFKKTVFGGGGMGATTSTQVFDFKEVVHEVDELNDGRT
jgi:hypothetical protein